MSKRIVVCDDHVSLLGIIKYLLSKRGFIVQTATNGEDALALMRAASPDMLILDLAMPDLDGIGVLKQMSTMTGKKPYVLVLSGQESGRLREEALSLGARELWKKPFNSAELMAHVESLVADGVF